MRNLIVEGHSDRNFFSAVQRFLRAADPAALPEFEVTYPASARIRPGKPGALKLFGMLLDDAAEPGRIERVGVVVDADFESQDGFVATNAALTAVLREKGFRMMDDVNRLYRHVASGSVASFWIPPNHADEGHIESMLLASLNDNERNYVDETVKPFVESLNPPRFQPQNTDRAQLYTYLAIQTKPDKSAPTLLDDSLINLDATAMRPFRQWITALFGVAQ